MSFFQRLSLFAALCAMAAMPARADTIHVAAAANLQGTYEALRQAFKKASGHDAVAVFNSSGRLYAQISRGADLDVFMSADMEYPQKLAAQGKAVGAPAVYAYGALVLWSHQRRDLTNWPVLLGSEAVRKIALGNPRYAPYGEEAMHTLKFYGIDARVANKLVYGDSIGQAHQYVDTGAVDIGFTAKSMVLANGGAGSWVDIPREAYQPLAQGVVLLHHGQNAHGAAAQEFLRFLSSPAARAIFEKGGYYLP